MLGQLFARMLLECCFESQVVSMVFLKRFRQLGAKESQLFARKMLDGFCVSDVAAVFSRFQYWLQDYKCFVARCESTIWGGLCYDVSRSMFLLHKSTPYSSMKYIYVLNIMILC